MSCGWGGKRRSGVAVAMRHRLQWFIHLRVHGLRKGDEHPAYSPHGVCHSFTFFTIRLRSSMVYFGGQVSGEGKYLTFCICQWQRHRCQLQLTAVRGEMAHMTADRQTTSSGEQCTGNDRFDAAPPSIRVRSQTTHVARRIRDCARSKHSECGGALVSTGARTLVSVRIQDTRPTRTFVPRISAA